ncbi:MAG: hypothetical protein Q4C05_01375 [Akkermansia sp.]|nr:hypothetical protein [Akkermansia sp.]
MKKPSYDLFVSYDEKGGALRRFLAEEFAKTHGIKKIWECGLREMKINDLPPADGIIRVHPIFMQSGITVTKKLPELLADLYTAVGQVPALEILPVWGGLREQWQRVCEFLTSYLTKEVGLLLMVHSVGGGQEACEAREFLHFLKSYRPEWFELECQIAYFGASPGIDEVCPKMTMQKLLVLPFLVSEGSHYHHDMPRVDQIRSFGKEMELLPSYGVFFVQECLKRQ